MPSKVQRRKKEQSECVARSKAVLLFGFADFCLMYVVSNSVVNNLTKGIYQIY